MEAAAVQKFSMDFLSICFSKPCQDDSKTGCVNKPIFKILHVQFSAAIKVTTQVQDLLHGSVRDSFLLCDFIRYYSTREIVHFLSRGHIQGALYGNHFWLL